MGARRRRLNAERLQAALDGAAPLYHFDLEEGEIRDVEHGNGGNDGIFITNSPRRAGSRQQGSASVQFLISF